MFSDKLKRYRRDLGLTQRDLGRKLDLSKATIGQLETGLKEPSRILLEKIYKISGKNMNWWLDKNEQFKFNQTFKYTIYPANKYKAIFPILFSAIFSAVLIFALTDRSNTLEVCIIFIAVLLCLMCTAYYTVLAYYLFKNKIYITIEDKYIEIKKISTTKRVNIANITEIEFTVRSRGSYPMVVIKCDNSTKYYYKDLYFPQSWFAKKDINSMVDNLKKSNENIWVIGRGNM
ncbi:Helix-turn-helix domain protein [Clostridium ljungdahlii DSM 13528]|uniref:Helix-turn-helix domain protein n=1 Tax=Clostridium ljungdahlii (strain ATCC 55383 / DSM 13528 / PETC) TaxID=748727 RepID=D8GSW6_CLOLD|nr:MULTISPECIES: helix-turn-helix transcriptional regulator [Clostridium]ADK14536.1 predicted transcription regulator with a HTH motif [Clostridium ljungdahlii DSM 13528]ALU37906.1 putative transcription regulator with a HTH motif [Clostridium autoethanogenum DSM 10061]OAA88046.1 Helix-turn-helix domain protein [Clostridium ljungdahlii DSM 13528]OVY49743.1 Helix-turn-helix domain protein [Clostridium autoethanogenum]